MAAKIISTLPKNDNSCGWIKHLPSRQIRPYLSSEQHADWVVLGGGYTGLSAPRQLSILHPQSCIILLEGQNVGEGSSARNSRFPVDSILNEGHFSASNLEKYLKKYDIKHAE